MTDARTSFTATYREARRSGLSGRLTFFRSGPAEVFVGDTGRLLVGRVGDYSDRPGAYASWLGSGTVACRRYVLDRSRSLPRVPLP